VNAHLEYAIKALGKCNAWYGPILETLVGGLDQESERIIEGIARASHGREFEVAANIYGMISDSPQALELARTRFSEADQTDTHEMVGAITFLGQAACCNHDESAADLLLPYLENNPYQTVARETLSGMPGDRAEALFLDYARRKPALTESYILKLLDRRRHPLSARERCACGWKREIHPQQK